jgi:ABC-type phosphate/phosphonate transport system permease subunit
MMVLETDAFGVTLEVIVSAPAGTQFGAWVASILAMWLNSSMISPTTISLHRSDVLLYRLFYQRCYLD